MTELMTRNQIVNLYKTLRLRATEKFNPKFSFFLLRNIKFLEEEVTVIDESNESLRTILAEYDKERNELISLLSDKDENGNPVLINNGQSYKMETNAAEFNSSMEQLTVKYADELSEYNTIALQSQELLNEEVEQQVLKISYLDIPSEEFTIAELTILKPFIKESEEELDELIMG